LYKHQGTKDSTSPIPQTSDFECRASENVENCYVFFLVLSYLMICRQSTVDIFIISVPCAIISLP